MDHRSRALRPNIAAADRPQVRAPSTGPNRVAWVGPLDPGGRRIRLAALVLDRSPAERQQLGAAHRHPGPPRLAACSRRSRRSCPTRRFTNRSWDKRLAGADPRSNTFRSAFPIVLAAALIAAAAVGLGDIVVRGLQLGEASLARGKNRRRFRCRGRTPGRPDARCRTDGMDRALADPDRARCSCCLRAVKRRLVEVKTLRARSVGRTPRPAAPPSSPITASKSPSRDWSAWIPVVVVVPFIAVMMLGAMLPAIDFDVLEYHLQGPKEYYQAGRIAFLPHNVYTNMPFGVEMLHLLGMEVLGDWWWGGLAGQLLVALFAPAAAVIVAATARRAGSVRAAWIAAIVYLSTPWIYRLAVIAYVEGPLCFYHAALVWCALRIGDPIGSAPAGSGSCWACWRALRWAASTPRLSPRSFRSGPWHWPTPGRTARPRPVLCYLVGWAVVMGPWLGKNVIDTGNPVYPLANRFFHGRYWDQARETQWSAVHGPRAITAHELADSLVDVAGRSDWQSPLYVALVPLAFARPGSRRLAAVLFGYVAYLFLTWWLLTHRLDRFWLPLLPALAVLAGLGGDWIKSRGWSMLLGAILTLGLLTNLTYVSTALAGLNEWTGDLVFLRRDIPRRLNAPLARLDAELPAGSRTLLVGQAAVFHLNHSISYNTVFNDETIETLAKGKSPEQFRDALRQHGLTHVYIDWKEIKRHRQPGGYGFTDFVTRSRAAGWVADGVLSTPVPLGADQELYRVTESNRIGSMNSIIYSDLIS